NLLHDRRRSLWTHRALATQQVKERFTLHVFHHEKEHTVSALSEIVNVNDVGMTNRCGGARFTFKTRDRFAFLQILVTENVRSNSLDCDLARQQVLIACEVNLAHRPATYTFLEQIT